MNAQANVGCEAILLCEPLHAPDPSGLGTPSVEQLLTPGPPPLTPPLQGGESSAAVALSARCPTTRRRRNWSRTCRTATSKEMHAFARTWRDQHRGQWFTVPKLSGFCLLMKRAVYEKIGGLDERFGLGFFDDDDLAERARRAGFSLAVAHDLFVHHFGSRTFVGNGVDAEKVLDENSRRFAAKWGFPESRGRRVALRPFPHTLSPAGRGIKGERANSLLYAQTPTTSPGFGHPLPGGARGNW